MYTGYQVNNILESLNPFQETKAVYSPHYSVFDILLCETDMSLWTIASDNNSKILKDTEISVVDQQYMYSQPYSLFISNHPIRYINENYAYNLHVNSIVFVHDYDSYNIKAEEKILACTKGFRFSDTLISFNSSIRDGLRCNKQNFYQIEYSIPDEFIDANSEREEIAVFCYNKSLSEELVKAIHKDTQVISKLPVSLSKINEEYNRYKVVVEVDPNSLINVLSAIACGSIGIINDPNNFLEGYKDIPNLYITKSVGEIQQLLSTKLTKKDAPLPNKYRNFNKFKEYINSIIHNNRKKAFRL